MSGPVGTVYSHTTIRVAGNAHAAEAPFVLLLIDGDDGSRLLGRFSSEEPPEVGARVRARENPAGVPVFEPAEESA
jgi:uncharacterized OB-fold protein